MALTLNIRPGIGALTWAGAGVAACSLLLLLVSANWISQRQHAASGWVSHTQEVLNALAAVRATRAELESIERGYVINGRDDVLDRYQRAHARVNGEVQALRDLVSDNPGQTRLATELASATQSRVAALDRVIAARRENGFAEARQLFDDDSARPQPDPPRLLLAQLQAEETRLLGERQREQDAAGNAFWYFLSGAVAVLAATFAGLYLLDHRRRATSLRLQRSEARFSLLADSAIDYAIILLDPEGRVVSWSPGARRIKGYDAHEIVGSHFSRFYPAEELADGKPARQLETAAREGRVVDEGWRVRKDGSRFWANVVITALRDANGKLEGFGKLTHDLTERRRAEDALRVEMRQRQRAELRLATMNARLEERVAARTDELRRSRDELRELGAAGHSAREQEKTRIARELHDELGQALTALKMDVVWLRAALPPDTLAADKLAGMQTLLDATVAATRRISADLRPAVLNDLGLAAAIELLARDFTRRSGVACEVAIGTAQLDLDDVHATALFRIVQESLTNIARHAKATQAEIAVSRDGPMLTVTVQDNGCGFDPADTRKPKSFGLLGLRERTYLLRGTITIASKPGAGTTIEISIPLDEPAPA